LVPTGTVYVDDRPRRRDLECVAAGFVVGAGLAAVAGAFMPNPFVITGIGALVGGVLGRTIAARVSPEEWDPRLARRPYVGASSPDDDIASE
jgi:hypothetical protein